MFPAVGRAARPLSQLRNLQSSVKNLACSSNLQPTVLDSSPRVPRSLTHLKNRSFTSSAPAAFIPVPYISERDGAGHHVTDLFSKLLKERIVCVYGEVNDLMAARVTASLLYLESDDPTRPISLYVDSYGGSVTAGLAIHDTMQYISCEVSTICLGSAMSMGSLLLASGQRGKRYCLPHSSIMLHQPSGGYSGQTSDILIHARHIERIRSQLNQIYLKNLTKSGLKIEDIERLLDRDNFLQQKKLKSWVL